MSSQKTNDNNLTEKQEVSDSQAYVNPDHNNSVVGKLEDDEAVNDIVENIFRRNHLELVSYIKGRVGVDADSAQELAQETFIALTKHVKSGAPIEHERGLIYKIAKTKIIDFYRHNNARKMDSYVELMEDTAVSKDFEHDRVIAGRQQLKQLKQVVLTLPPKCQMVFVMRAFEEMSCGDIAKRCGISVSMVEKHLTKAYGRIREHYANEAD